MSRTHGGTWDGSVWLIIARREDVQIAEMSWREGLRREYEERLDVYADDGLDQVAYARWRAEVALRHALSTLR